MIQEIDSHQFVKHYFDKVYKELDHSPEDFLRAALEYVHREAGLFTQPGAMESLRRLAEQIADNDDAAVTAPDTARHPAPDQVSMGEATTSTDGAAASGPMHAAPRQATPATPAPAASTEMADASAAVATATDVDNNNDGDDDAVESGGSGIKPNEGNGADLPTYRWTQSLQEAVVTVPVPPGTKGRACDVAITRTTLRVGLHGAEAPILNGDLFAPVVADECLWSLVDGSSLEITLHKADGMQWWKAVVVGEPEIDTQKVEPEASKLSDLDPETRATVEKMMFDQQQKALGLPTSEESKKDAIMKQFMAAHPEMDFSNAKFM